MLFFHVMLLWNMFLNGQNYIVSIRGLGDTKMAKDTLVLLVKKKHWYGPLDGGRMYAANS
jgi:hypothetical protein